MLNILLQLEVADGKGVRRRRNEHDARCTLRELCSPVHSEGPEAALLFPNLCCHRARGDQEVSIGVYWQKRLRLAVTELGRARPLWAHGLPVRLTEEVERAERYSPAQFAEVLASVRGLARGRTITVFADCERIRALASTRGALSSRLTGPQKAYLKGTLNG